VTASAKGLEDNKNHSNKSNETQQELNTNSTTFSENNYKESEVAEDNKGERLKVNLKDSNITQTKASITSDSKNSQNAAPQIEDKKDEANNKSISKPKNQTNLGKTEIESLSEDYSKETKKSNDSIIKNEVDYSNNNSINNTSKKDSSSISEIADLKDSSDSKTQDSKKPDDSYFINSWL